MQVMDRYPRVAGEEFQLDAVSIERMSLVGKGSIASGDRLEPEAGAFAPPVVWPNPAHGTATLRFSNARAGGVKAEVFDLSGRRVRMLADGSAAEAGGHEFALETRRPGEPALARGIYFYRVAMPEGVFTGRFVMIE
jgi:hypothetical protein